MYSIKSIPSLVALGIICVIFRIVEAAPIPVRPIPAQTLLYNGAGGQVPLSPPPSSPNSNSSRPLSFQLPNWVTAPYPRSLKAEDRNVFETILSGLTLASRHSFAGANNAGVYSVASFSSSFAQLFPPSLPASTNPSRLLVKILKEVNDDMIAEVKALKIVGQFVASGKMRVPVAKSNEKGKGKIGRGHNANSAETEDEFELKPVIVMLKMTGTPLTSTPGYIASKDPETRKRMMGDTLNMMCDRVGKLALEHRFVHRDNIIQNVLVISEGTRVVDVNIIDWGGKYLSSIRDDVTWDNLMAWCHNRWAVYVWEAAL